MRRKASCILASIAQKILPLSFCSSHAVSRTLVKASFLMLQRVLAVHLGQLNRLRLVVLLVSTDR
jgi:hypothetical protein